MIHQSRRTPPTPAVPRAAPRHRHHRLRPLPRAHPHELGHGPRITIASNLFSAGRKWVDHEMLHYWLILTGRDTQHQDDDWYAAIRRLSPAVLGHDLNVRRGRDRQSVRIPNPAYEPGKGQPTTLVRKVRREDAIAHTDVARWPGSFRPPSYDWGTPIDCPTY